MKFWMLLLAFLISLGLALGTSWAIVASQNPGTVDQPLTDYGPVT